MRRSALALALLLAGCHPSSARTYAVVGATVLAATAPIPDGVVIVDQGRVAAVGTRAHTSIPKGASMVDGTGRWVASHPGGGPVGIGMPGDVALYRGDPRSGAAVDRVLLSPRS